ncbi:hypothetical protein [Rhizobium sp. GCM10022189]|uniref:hypothetical protein n=1 Tax=Rhizobium sp. GCM10022189 TaxID=3252654 RepID=UPI00360D4248
MTGLPRRPGTVFAEPDRPRKRPGSHRRYRGDADIWENIYPEPGKSDRNIAIRNRPDLIPVEERKSIVSNRVQIVDPLSNTSMWLESDLEGAAMAIFLAHPAVVAVRPQFGPVPFEKDGRRRQHYFDLRVDYRSGARGLFAIRNSETAAEVDADLELIRAQSLRRFGHFVKTLTEQEITKAAVYRANSILRARVMNNEKNNRAILDALRRLGGRARVYDVLATPDVVFSHGWDALWALIDRGVVVHDHPKHSEINLERHSWVRLKRN